MKLNEINFYAELLRMLKRDYVQYRHIYDDAIDGLLELGLKEENGVIVIDELVFPVHAPSEESSDSLLLGQSSNASEEKEAQRQTRKSICEPQFFMDFHKIKLINKRNPNDISEYDIIVVPISLYDNKNIAEIAVKIEHKDEEVLFVSGQTGKIAIQASVGGSDFSIRGAWENRKFSSKIYLNGVRKEKYDLKDETKSFCPVDAVPKDFEADFVRVIGETKITILPYSKINEPNGYAKTFIIVDDSTPQIYSDPSGIVHIDIDSMRYRAYGRWKDDAFEAMIETV